MNFTYSEIDEFGNITELTEQDLKDRARDKFFRWFKTIGDKLGWTNEEAAERLSDSSWFFCYADGLTPEQTIEEAKLAGVI